MSRRLTEPQRLAAAKVYGWHSWRASASHRQTREVVLAVPSLAAVMRAYSLRRSDMVNLSETGNAEEEQLARQFPGMILWTELVGGTARVWRLVDPNGGELVLDANRPLTDAENDEWLDYIHSLRPAEIRRLLAARK